MRPRRLATNLLRSLDRRASAGCSGAAPADAAGTRLLIAENTDLLVGLCSRVVVVDAGALAAVGPTTQVLADPRLDQWGVEPPDRVRLSRSLAAAGVSAELPQ
jgi:hypothetical protein